MVWRHGLKKTWSFERNSFSRFEVGLRKILKRSLEEENLKRSLERRLNGKLLEKEENLKKSSKDFKKDEKDWGFKEGYEEEEKEDDEKRRKKEQNGSL